MCRYSIKATTFAGIYVDGDRERVAYEATLISRRPVLHRRECADRTRPYDRLMKLPTWPTEWSAHMVFIAHADWMQTGDTKWLAPRYAALKTKLHLEQARADGLIVSNGKQITTATSWTGRTRAGWIRFPTREQCNKRLSPAGSGLHGRTRPRPASRCGRRRLRRPRNHHPRSLSEKSLRSAQGLYRDGQGTDHASLHANLFPLAFGLVPAENRAHVAQWLGERGMVCSVYAAQYLLESLFENDEATKAIELIAAPGDRSWKHMVESGTTITWEAWDQRYKKSGLEPRLGCRANLCHDSFSCTTACTQPDACHRPPKSRHGEKG